jgi:hypothetical protein
VTLQTPSPCSLKDLTDLQDLLLVTSGELSLDMERAKLVHPTSNMECARSMLVPTLTRFIKHRATLVHDAAEQCIATALGIAGGGGSALGAYYSRAGDFDLQLWLCGDVDCRTGTGSETQLISFCDTLQRAYDRRAAVQNGMRDFKDMPLCK